MAKVIREVADEELWSSVMGSAWETWEWWLWVDYVEGSWETPGEMWVVVLNPWEDEADPWEDGVLSAKVTLPDIERALGELTEHQGVMECLSRDELDFDSVMGDVVIQQAVLGDEIYA